MSTATLLLHMLHRANQLANDEFAGRAGEIGVTPRQYIVLQAIEERIKPSQTDLVDATAIDRSTLADIVRRLLNKGLVARKRTQEDTRKYALKLTEKGKAVLISAKPAALAVDQKILSVLPLDQRKAFLAMMAKIVAAAEVARLACEPGGKG